MAVRVGVTDVAPIVKVPVAPLVSVLAPAKVVETSKLPLLVVVPLMVKAGIAVVVEPLIVLPVPENV